MEKKPVILFCINKLGSGSGLGGAERLVVDDINEMQKLGYLVRLLTLRHESRFSITEEVELPKQYWQAIHFGSFFNILNWIKIYLYFKKEKPDVVFSHLWFSNTIIRIVCKIAGVKNVFSFEHNVYDTVKSKKMYFMDKLLQGWSKKIIAVSSAVKDSLLKHGIKEKNIVVINNGINISKYNISPNELFKKQLGIPSGSFMFLTIGRLISQKGIDILLRAFAKIQEDPVLVIVGQGEDENLLKKLSITLGIDERVYFLGIRHDVPDVLSISDCFVLASRYEGLGIVVLEAMAGKKPIIISNFSAGKDMITNNVSGLVVEIENVDALSQAMNTLLINEDLRQRLAKSAYEKVQEFSIKEHINKLLRL
jgi:glycosyltransferase involved in cell wall biosynthesis